MILLSCAAAVSWDAFLHVDLLVRLLLACHSLMYVYHMANGTWLAPQYMLGLLCLCSLKSCACRSQTSMAGKVKAHSMMTSSAHVAMTSSC